MVIKVKKNLNLKNLNLIKKITLIISISLLFFILFFQVSCCYGFDLNFPNSIEQNKTNQAGQENNSSGFSDSDTSETTLEESTPLKIPELEVISKLKVPGQAIDVKSLGSYAYLTNDLGTLYIIDVKDKQNPKIVGKCSGIDSANIVMLQGNYAYVSYTNWILPKDSQSSDDSDNSDNNLFEIDQSDSDSTIKIYSICGFKIIDIMDKKNPKVVGDFISGSNEEKSVQGMVIDGDFAYLNTTNYFTNYTKSKLEIVDIKDKKNPRLIGYCEIEGQPNGIDVQGDYAYINNTYYDFVKKDYLKQSKFFVVNVKNKNKPEVVGSCEVFANSWSVLVEKNYAYLSSSIYDSEIQEYKDSMLQVIDIKEPQNPLPIGKCTIFGGAWELDIKDNFLFVSNNEGGLSVVNISDPKNPVTAAFLSTGGNSYDIAISGDYGYIADGFEGLIIVSLQKKAPGEGMVIEQDKDKKSKKESANQKPIAEIEVFGDKAKANIVVGTDNTYTDKALDNNNGADTTDGQDNSNGAGSDIGSDNQQYLSGDLYYSYYVDNPVYFSAINSYDPKGKNLKYTWKINKKMIIDEEIIDEELSGNNLAKNKIFLKKPEDLAAISEKKDKLVYFFDKPGTYKVSLEVSDGDLIDEKTLNINISPINDVIKPLKKHNFNIEIECILENKSDIDLKNIEVYLRVPQTYAPYQIINSIFLSQVSSIESISKVFDNSWNMLAHIVFDKSLKVLKGQTFKTSITANVTMYEYTFKNLQINELKYEEGDDDLIKFTQEDLFIDIDSPLLIEAVKKVIGNETNPIIKAKKLYNFVTDKLYYDFARAANKNYEFMSASEILKKGKGVCADYAILYVALLRIAGIPSRVVGGIPVTLILSEKNKELDVGHAWVEIKLPGYGWIPIDITQEEGFMKADYFLNVATEKGTSFLYESQTMDWSSYYYDGFKYKWDGQDTPKIEQKLIYRVKDLGLKDLYIYS